MDEHQVKALMLFLNAGIKVMSARLVLLLSMLLSFALFAWVMAEPEPLRVAAATLFALLVFLPVVRLDQKQAEHRQVVQTE